MAFAAHPLQGSAGDRVAGRTNPWTVALAYTILVILFGAVVRITGSGAGCGQHWPTCQGEIAPLPRTMEMSIEFTHRLTSGVSLVVVLGLTLLAFRRRPAGHPERRGAALATAFILVEALIGAAIVLLRYVADDDSVGRAVMMPLHLVNTLALTGVLGVLALGWRKRGLHFDWRHPVARALLAGGLGIALVAAAGAVTALGDTLYPVEATGGALDRAQLSPGRHFLEQLRGLHPLLAIAVSGVLLWMAPGIAGRCPSPVRAARWSRAVTACVYGQLALGLLNVWLSAPGWMQIVHLAAALLLWLGWVGLAFTALARFDGPVEPGRTPASVPSQAGLSPTGAP